MNFKETPLKGCYTVESERYSDDRGWFARTYCKNEFLAAGFDQEWVQHNHSYTKLSGTIRGMHFQRTPFKETKLVRCIAGKVLDVVVDLRRQSETFLHWFAVELQPRNSLMILIPEGFAHGFQTLEDDSELLYCHNKFYNPASEGGINFLDPAIGIQWPLAVTHVSVRDLNHPKLTADFSGI